MPRVQKLRAWQWVHRWSSLVCTVFLLSACITGLPLVFQDEIVAWNSSGRAAASMPVPNRPRASLDQLRDTSRRMFPGHVITSMVLNDEAPVVLVNMVPSVAVAASDPKVTRTIRFDAYSGEALQRPSANRRPPPNRPNVMAIAREMHENLFAGLAGELILATMAALFLVAIVSGVVLYGPFTSKLEFGTVRAGRSRRVKWLDLHNLLGVTTMAWAAIVGATGIMNAVSTPLFAAWKQSNTTTLLASYQGVPAVSPDRLASPQRAVETAASALPGMRIWLVVFPGAETSGPHHYLVWGRGDSNLTKRLSRPVLIDGRTGALTAVVKMPWYLRVLQLSRPLHFGDYGGLPLKIIWALLDVATIIVLGSGLYLWVARRRRPAQQGIVRPTESILEPAQ